MSSDRYIRYVLLNVGDPRNMVRSEVPDAAVTMLRPLLDRDGVTPAIIPQLPWRMTHTRMGTMLYVTLADDRGDMAAFAVAVRDRGAAALWADLHATALDRYASDPDAAPSAPWCGLAVSARMRQEPRERMHATIGLAKATAWTWIEMRSRQDA